MRRPERPGAATPPACANTHLAAAVVGLRQRGHQVSGDDQAAARTALEGLTVKLLKAGERRRLFIRRLPTLAESSGPPAPVPRLSRHSLSHRGTPFERR